MKSTFLSEVSDHLRAEHYSIRTEKTYLYWIANFIHHHNYRHHKDMGQDEIRGFLSYLAINRQVFSNTQKIDLNALIYLYKRFCERELGDLSDFQRAKSDQKIPTVLTRNDVKSLLSRLQGDAKLCATLMYGSGLRVMETVRLRLQDIDFDKLTVSVRDAKGHKSGITTLAPELCQTLRAHLDHVESRYQDDTLDALWDGVYLPYALALKYPSAPFELGWQYLFPAKKLSLDPHSGKCQRHHLSEQRVQRAIKIAVRQSLNGKGQDLMEWSAPLPNGFK